MKAVEAYFKKDAYARLAGIQLLEVSEGRAKAMLAITEHHRNSAGTVHGGVIFTLADFAFAAAAHSQGTVAVAISSSISFFKAVSAGVVYAEAREISIHPKLASYRVEVTDDKNELIASFQGMAFRKRDMLAIE
jgi:acyl-CoA thioesterase